MRKSRFSLVEARACVKTSVAKPVGSFASFSLSLSLSFSFSCNWRWPYCITQIDRPRAWLSWGD